MDEKMARQDLTFARAFGGRFQISSTALAIARLYIQNTQEKPESGGVLLGRHILDTYDIIVDSITRPMPGDRQNRFHFFRAQQPHQEEIDRAWQESNGTCTYLGEWHTHPEQHPIPSPIDYINWQTRLGIDQFTEPIFFIIIGTTCVYAWEGHRQRSLMALRQL